MSELESLGKLLEQVDRVKENGLTIETTVSVVLAWIEEVQTEVDSAYMRLPIDADGEPIHPDDCMIDGSARADGLGKSRWDVASVNEHAFFDIGGNVHIPRECRHQPTVEQLMGEYAELSSSEDVKRHREVSDELRRIQHEQFRDEPELELYKEANGYKFYLELPYDELHIYSDRVEVKHHSYSYMYENPNGGSTYSCSSLCGYSREDVINQIDSNIERIERELEEAVSGDDR